MKKVVITGITGQDGAYLAQFLIQKGFKVFGTYRRTSSENFWRLDYLGIRNHANLELVEFDLLDSGSAFRLMRSIRPAEVYNLAAQSFVSVSFDQPIATGQITGLGALNLLEAIRHIDSSIKFYQASTSEMYGLVQEIPQNENTKFYPRSPYAVAKLYAHWMTINYAESYGMFCTSGILFNHESPLRGKEFVTRKITDTVARIYLGKNEVLELGNLDAKRDWGFARDYVEGMFLMMQQETAGTYVLATGNTHSVRDFVNLSFKHVGIELEWIGKGINEKGVDTKNGRLLVKVNENYYRPSEVDILIGDASKAAKSLGWSSKTDLDTLCREMVQSDIEKNKNGASY